MRTDNLVRGFGEINDRLIEEALRIEEKEAIAKKRKIEKIIKITGITAACTAAAALLITTLFLGLFRQKEGVPLGPAVTLEPETTEAVTDAEEFSDSWYPYEKPSDVWVTAKFMQQFDDQFLYTHTEYDDSGLARDTRVQVLPLLFEEDSVPVDWVIPRESETIGNTIAKLDGYLYFTRIGNLNTDICRKSFVTQEEEILYSAESQFLLKYTGLNKDPGQIYETVSLLAVSDEKIVFGFGEEGYRLYVFLYDMSSGSLTYLGMRGGAHIVSIDTLPGKEKVCFTFDGGSNDVSASKLWVVSEDGTVLLDKRSFTSGAENGFLYYRDDVLPVEWDPEEETTVSIHRYCYADGTDEVVFQKTLRNYLQLRLHGGLIWTYDTDTEEAYVFDPDSPDRQIILPDDNGNVLKAGDTYFTVTKDAIYTLDPGSGTCVKAADLESGTEGYSITQFFLYAEDQGVLIYFRYGNAGRLNRLILS